MRIVTAEEHSSKLVPLIPNTWMRSLIDNVPKQAQLVKYRGGRARSGIRVELESLSNHSPTRLADSESMPVSVRMLYRLGKGAWH